MENPASLEELRHVVALRLVPGLGDKGIVRLLRRAGSARSVWALEDPGAEVPFLRASAVSALRQGPDWSRVDRVLERLLEMEGWAVYWGGPGYPPSLSELPDPPPVLFGLGDPGVMSAGPVAVVGARKATGYGRRVAADLAKGLAAVGIPTISGLALGIDAAAHHGSLEGGAATVAVLGCGLDVDYPRTNRGLKQRVSEKGAVVTEFEPGTKPEAPNFPRRNRIISGLARAVVVVEAGERSGSLITASHALEQGKDVFAVPGSIYSPVSRGTHWLIRQGAPLVGSVEDLLEELGCHAGQQEGEAGEGYRLTREEESVISALEPYPLHLDEIAAKLGMPVAEVGRILVNLELNDMVTALPGHMYQRR